MDQLVTIEIFGYPFTFKADSDVDKAREVAAYLQDTVGKLEAQHTHKGTKIDKRAILILTALNITSEYFSYREENEALLDAIRKRCDHLFEKVAAAC
ncbi:MAG: cell division protein ZapA [Desulfosarcinaceae bacterium]|nr:cell division protein ZapA [Desulfosarcinaceae bacterium]